MVQLIKPRVGCSYLPAVALWRVRRPGSGGGLWVSRSWICCTDGS